MATAMPRPTCGRVRRFAAAASLLAIASAAQAALPPFASFTLIGAVENHCDPAVWQHHQIDVSALLGGASNAQLSFDLSNDQPGTGSTATNLPTNAHLYFAADAAGYYLNFEYFFVAAHGIIPDGQSSAEMRDVRLVIDGAAYADQYAAFNNHFGDALTGTAIDGDGPGANILGQTGFEARTYVLAAVPEPATCALLLARLGLVGALAKRRAGGR